MISVMQLWMACQEYNSVTTSLGHQQRQGSCWAELEDGATVYPHVA